MARTTLQHFKFGMCTVRPHYNTIYMLTKCLLLTVSVDIHFHKAKFYPGYLA